MKLSDVRLSVCRVIRPPHAAAVGLLLWARRAGEIDGLLHGRRRRHPVATVGCEGVTLSADVESWTRIC